MPSIHYRSGYQYQLAVDYAIQLPFTPAQPVAEDFLELNTSGLLTIKKGYAWDGPSGPTFDTKGFMRPSLVHDALYQLIRLGHLNAAEHRKPADDLLHQLCKEDGMWGIRAWWVWLAVRWFGAPNTDPQAEHAVETAP